MGRRATARAIRRAASFLLGAFGLLLAAQGAQAATCPFVSGGNYSGGSFVGASCKKASLTTVTLSFADLTSANFQNAAVQSSILDYANLLNANLQGTNFTNTSLVGVNFTGANIKSVNFSGANLAGANFSGVSFNPKTSWAGATYSSTTTLPAAIAANPTAYGLILPEPKIAMLLLVAAALFLLPRLDRHA